MPGLEAPALFGLGRSPCCGATTQSAIDDFNKALQLDPAATSIHYPLGTGPARGKTRRGGKASIWRNAVTACPP